MVAIMELLPQDRLRPFVSGKTLLKCAALTLASELVPICAAATLKSAAAGLTTPAPKFELSGEQRGTDDDGNESAQSESNSHVKRPPAGHEDGPMPTISDSEFSLIILIYVSVIFIFMFFSFCWKEPDPPPPDPAHKDIPMITSMLEEMERAEAEAAAAAAAAASEDAGNGAELKENGDANGGGESHEMTELKEKSLMSHEDVANGAGNNGAGSSKIVVNVITEKAASTTLPPINGSNNKTVSPVKNVSTAEGKTAATQV